MNMDVKSQVKEPHLLAIDQGTSSSRAILFSKDGEIRSIFQKEIALCYPNSGWVEQDPRDIIRTTLWAIQRIVFENPGIEIAGAGITNQRETTVLWDKTTGEPIYNAIVWQDRRTAEYCAALRAQGYEEMVRRKTGLLLDPYFSATKIRWILQHVDGAMEKARRGEVLFGTTETFLIWHLTKGARHVSDASNASRTMLYNVVDQCWDSDLLELFDVPTGILPVVDDNVSDFGQIDRGYLVDSAMDIRIGGAAGDQQAALIGQACFSPGMIKSTYGTGCFALMNIGGDFVESKNRLLTTIAYRINGSVTYAAEGSIFNAGTAIQYLRDNLTFFDHARDSEDLALSVQDSGGVYFVPSFTGLGAPYWNAEARGLICGLGRDSTKAHITRAALEAQGYQTRDLMQAMQDDTGRIIGNLRVDGGLVVNRFMCQFLSDVLQRSVEVPRVTESTAWGAACLAGVQAGVFSSLENVGRNWKSADSYMPQRSLEEMDAHYSGWLEAVARVNLAGM